MVPKSIAVLLVLLTAVIGATPARADAATAYFFGRTLGQSLKGVVRSGAAFAKTKQQASIEIQGARQAFWDSYPTGANRRQAEQRFHNLLNQKDFALLAFYLPEGITPRSHTMARLGGQIDNGLADAARPAFFEWVVALREFLGARRHYVGNNGELPDLVVAGPAQILAALDAEDVREKYAAYQLLRDRAEFAAVGREADFDRLLDRAKDAAAADEPRQRIETIDFVVTDKDRVTLRADKHDRQMGRTIVAGGARVVFGGHNDQFFLLDTGRKRASKGIGPRKGEDNRPFFRLSADIAAPYLIVGDATGQRTATFLQRIAGGRRMRLSNGAYGVAHVYDVHTGKKVAALAPEILKAGANRSGARLNQSASPRFGASVALYGHYAIVGAPGEKHGRGSARFGVDGHGAAYIFDIRDGRQIARLVGTGKRGFGKVVAINGRYAAVSAPGEPPGRASDPEVALFELATGRKVATFRSPRTRAGTGFGVTLAMNDTHLLIGAPGASQAVYGFELARRRLDFTLSAGDLTEAKHSGFGLGLALKGSTACIGAYREATVYCVDTRKRDRALALRRDRASERSPAPTGSFFGQGVDFQQGRIVIGAPGENRGAGEVYVVTPGTGVVSLSPSLPRAQRFTFTAPTDVLKPHVNARRCARRARDYRRPGPNRVTCRCLPGDRSNKRIYGTGVYASDSDICRAARHAGLIGLDGGVVTYEIMPGQRVYTGSKANGIASESWKKGWHTSFRFVGDTPEKGKAASGTPGDRTPQSRRGAPQAAPKAPKVATCRRYADAYAGRHETVRCFCPSGKPTAPRLYGTGIYTSDSHVCLAARHAGVISESGGVVSFRFLPGRSRYQGSVANGVRSADWLKPWRSSFRFN